jgi:CRP-like cAMP-binding protein
VIETSEIDLRSAPVWERPGIVEAALDSLPSGAALTFITENEPRGLSTRIGEERSKGFLIETRRVAGRVWHINFTSRHEDHERHPRMRQLGSCAAFARLEPAAREALAAAAVEQVGRRGETLVAENEEWPYVGMVVDGIIARAKGAQNERQRILYEIFPYEVFGVAEYFDRGLTNARTMVFSKTAIVLKFPWDAVREIAVRHPQLTNELGVVIAQRLRLVNDNLSAQASQPIIARIAHVLLPYAMPERGLTEAAGALAAVTQSQIAASAGTVKEVAARAIAELESRGALRRERGHVRYLDRQRLLELIQQLS